jgi:hypothetical protein
MRTFGCKFPSTKNEGMAEQSSKKVALKWIRRELADAAGITPWVVGAFEDGRDILRHSEIEIREALEAVGIGFPFEIADGQFKPAGIAALEGKRTGVERLIGPANWFAPAEQPRPAQPGGRLAFVPYDIPK